MKEMFGHKCYIDAWVGSADVKDEQQISGYLYLHSEHIFRLHGDIEWTEKDGIYRARLMQHRHHLTRFTIVHASRTFLLISLMRHPAYWVNRRR